MKIFHLQSMPQVRSSKAKCQKQKLTFKSRIECVLPFQMASNLKSYDLQGDKTNVKQKNFTHLHHLLFNILCMVNALPI